MDEAIESAGPELVAELNDLLQLDHDAVQAYSVAIERLRDPQHRETLIRFREDHERHIRELTRLIRDVGGLPIPLAHVPTGLFKLAVQRVGAAGGDRGLLLAFKANEAQVQEKYARHAEAAPPGPIAQQLLAHAADEERHYDWVVSVLEVLGAGEDTPLGRAEAAFEGVHTRAADAVEEAERGAMRRAEELRRRAIRMPEYARRSASRRLMETAHAIDRVSDRVAVRGGPVARLGGVGRELAETVEGAGDYIRTRDFGGMRSDLEREVEHRPLRSVLVAAGIGFALGRLLR